MKKVYANLKLWFKDGQEEALQVELPDYPQVGDQFLYKDRWWTVTVRAFDLDNQDRDYEKVHLKENTTNVPGEHDLIHDLIIKKFNDL